MNALYVVATPVGNLKDITLRALEILRSADLILCEDTRVTKKLLEHYQIRTATLSYHQHSKLEKVDHILGLLRQGKNIALVSDAGTPGISDPGGKLVKKAIESLGNSVEVISVPGPSALTASASVAGLSMDKFLFLGFPPVKKKRKKFFEEIVNSKYPVIFYESPHRIIKTLDELNTISKPYTLNPKVVVCRELTKKFEQILRGTIEEVLNQLSRSEIKGELVVIVDKR
jgi:16S rRNA (cytidine1402-2'-O)-methyltransferase